MRALFRIAITCVAASAWSGCVDAQGDSRPGTSATGSSANGSQVLITFQRNTPPERIEKVASELGVRVDQTMFNRIVLGSSPSHRTVEDLQKAASKYPEIVGVEPSSKVRAQ